MQSILCPHVELRPWRPEDEASLVRHANNVRIWNNVRDFFPHPYTLEDARAYIALACAKPRVEDMALVVDGEPVGGIGFLSQTDVERYNVELGYWIGESYWGMGLMSEAVAGFIAYVFSLDEIHRIFALVYDHNLPSMRILEKNGFRQAGLMREGAYKNGRFIDYHYYELLKP